MTKKKQSRRGSRRPSRDALLKALADNGRLAQLTRENAAKLEHLGVMAENICDERWGAAFEFGEGLLTALGLTDMGTCPRCLDENVPLVKVCVPHFCVICLGQDHGLIDADY